MEWGGGGGEEEGEMGKDGMWGEKMRKVKVERSDGERQRRMREGEGGVKSFSNQITRQRKREEKIQNEISLFKLKALTFSSIA